MNAWTKKPAPAPAPSRELAGKDHVTGVVENVVFHSDETGYTVCSVKVPEQKRAITVVGNCPAIWAGETLTAQGSWTRHPRHGYQLQAESLTCVPPASAKGIERYLASGMIHGIGKVMAKRLVKAFGADTLHVIEKESVRLEEVEGIGPVRRSKIKASWIEQHAVRDIMIYLQGHGVGAAQAARIFRRYGDKAIDTIRENPYRLCTDVWGVGFKTADGVAQSVGIPRESEVRARAGLIYVLQTQTEEGHCFCMEPELILQTQALLDIPAEVLAVALNHQVERQALVREEGRIYLAAIYRAEVETAAKLRRLQATGVPFKPIQIDRAIPWAAERMRVAFAPRQQDALGMALGSKVSIITGGPGVGKTTIIRALVDIYKKRSLRVTLAAPTGRAAKRMEEATHHAATTLHRLLKFMPRTNQFEYGPDKPLPGDVFILDETSMIDIGLIRHFLVALPDTATLVLVGDTDQLPSVGPGNVLRDLIQSGAIPFTRLDRIFRQESGGYIVQNAHRVNQGEMLEIPPPGEMSDFYFVETEDADQVVQRVLELVSQRIPRRFGFDPIADVQVLTPMRRNQLGAENLNGVLQEALNGHGPALERFGRAYRQNDRVMQIRNNYDKEVFNGDVGRIVRVDPEERCLVVDFDGRRVDYDAVDLDELVHAYACSIHKSQGSEYPAVVILMTTQHFKMLQRNLLYTAITRGRELVCLVGSSKAVGMAIRNNEIRLRRTGLEARLR